MTTLLNGVWDSVSPKILNLIKAWKIKQSSINPAHFFTHRPPGEEEKGYLGLVVIWVSVNPGSTFSYTAYDVSKEILDLLQKNGVENAVVEWQEAILQRLADQPLIHYVSSKNSTHYVHCFLTPLLGIPLVTEVIEAEDSQDTLTLWFYKCYAPVTLH